MTIYELLDQTTVMLRKGAAITEEEIAGVHVTHLYAMGHESSAGDDEFDKIDVHFITVAVRKNEVSEKLKAEFERYCREDYPTPERLAAGPSYIEIGAELGSQDYALRFMALGKHLGLWEIITPATFGAEGEQADAMAGSGFVMTSGLHT